MTAMEFEILVSGAQVEWNALTAQAFSPFESTQQPSERDPR